LGQHRDRVDRVAAVDYARDTHKPGGGLMRSPLAQFLAAIVFSLGVAAPASAITGNYVKDFEHPFVGFAVFYDGTGEFAYRCSGSLLTPTVFLTAGHCAGGGGVTARVYFQQDAGAHYDPVTQEDPVSGYPDTCAAATLGTLCATSNKL
jgi:hypothetical protein